MPEKATQSMQAIHMVYGVLFAAIAIAAIFALVMYRSLTDTGTQQSSVTNASPSFNNVYTADNSDTTNYSGDSTTVTLVEDTGDDLYIHGQATDTNGCDDITAASSTWTLKLYTSGTGSSACSSTNSFDCYNFTESNATSFSTANCTAASGNTTINYEWRVPMKYFADYSDNDSETWVAEVAVSDYNAGASATSSAVSDTFEVARIAGLNTSSIGLNFGSLALGGTSGTSSITIYNTGNGQIDLTASASDFSCPTGKIAASQVKFTTSATTAYASMANALSNGGTTDTAFNLAGQSTTSASSTKDTYWAISVPATGAGGSCSTTVTLSAASG